MADLSRGIAGGFARVGSQNEQCLKEKARAAVKGTVNFSIIPEYRTCSQTLDKASGQGGGRIWPVLITGRACWQGTIGTAALVLCGQQGGDGGGWA